MDGHGSVAFGNPGEEGLRVSFAAIRTDGLTIGPARFDDGVALDGYSPGALASSPSVDLTPWLDLPYGG